MSDLKQIKTQKHVRSMNSVRHSTGCSTFSNWRRLRETERLDSTVAQLNSFRTGHRIRGSRAGMPPRCCRKPVLVLR